MAKLLFSPEAAAVLMSMKDAYEQETDNVDSLEPEESGHAKLTEEEWVAVEAWLMADPEFLAILEADRKDPDRYIELDWRSL
jgi:hypothetical protein